MKKTPSITAILAIVASGATANPSDIYDKYIPMQPHERGVFPADRECVENNLKSYVGKVDYFVDGDSFISAGREEFNAIVRLDEDPSSQSNVLVTSLEVSSPDTESIISLMSHKIDAVLIQHPFSLAAHNDGHPIKGRYDAKALEDLLRTCPTIDGRVPAIS